MARICLLPESENVSLILNESCTPGFHSLLPKRPKMLAVQSIITQEIKRRFRERNYMGQRKGKEEGPMVRPRLGLLKHQGAVCWQVHRRADRNHCHHKRLTHTGTRDFLRPSQGPKFANNITESPTLPPDVQECQGSTHCPAEGSSGVVTLKQAQRAASLERHDRRLGTQ